MAKRVAKIGCMPILVVIGLLVSASIYIEESAGTWWKNLTSSDEFRVEEMEYWPTHPEAHPDYVVLRERAFELIPRVLYNYGITEIDGIPISAEGMVVTTPLVPGAWGQGRETYNQWELITDKKLPIYAVTEQVRGANVVKNRIPQDWYRHFLNTSTLRDPAWLGYGVMIADPQSWSEEWLARTQGPYAPLHVTVTFALEVQPAADDPDRLEITRIVLRGRADSAQASRASFWRDFLGRINTPYDVPVVNDEVFHGISRGDWAPGSCERRRVKAFCETLVKNTRSFPIPGREVKDSF
ncbi:hypothetical protein [Marinimicrobium sp. ABcell2]|uniref:hypothetical protein n=1 Tax=Marinimicrobium sp. ABcell2 TaxID=3069751 RepID=UPI0027B73023|nr:hypothetical protein [Marinimicrobium sp. ABcell2]MDQ2077523.1 hypothetical protein [Marinimicrobium sp. ABcell2]